MTKQTKALKLALEALELEDMACRYEKDPTPEHIAKAITAIREALAEQPAQQQDIFECDVQARPLSYPLRDYHRAMSEGPLHYTWTDKPHRLVYDLIAAVKYYAAPQQPAQQQEPVAYMGTDIEGNPNKFRLNPFGGCIPLYEKPQSVKVRDAEGYDALCQQLEGWKAKVSKPWVGLTDEQIYKIANDLFYGNGPCDTLAMCRAIEAAHGIKENT